jgi:hypothetical protein
MWLMWCRYHSLCVSRAKLSIHTIFAPSLSIVRGLESILIVLHELQQQAKFPYYLRHIAIDVAHTVCTILTEFKKHQSSEITTLNYKHSISTRVSLAFAWRELCNSFTILIQYLIRLQSLSCAAIDQWWLRNRCATTLQSINVSNYRAIHCASNFYSLRDRYQLLRTRLALQPLCNA